MNPPKMKKCTGCNQYKPATRQFFHHDNAIRDGFKYRCIVCTADYMKDYIPTNERPRLTAEQLAEITARYGARELKSRIEKAAKDAVYAGKGIVLDGVELDIKIKMCDKCKIQKPATTDYFHQKNQNKDGFTGKCKLCSEKNNGKVYQEKRS